MKPEVVHTIGEISRWSKRLKQRNEVDSKFRVKSLAFSLYLHLNKTSYFFNLAITMELE